MADADARQTRRSYAGTVLAGLAGAALTAVAGSRTWGTGKASAAGMHVGVTVSGSQVAPLVAALGLVALAAWGVLLVTRGRVRRGMAAVGLLAALGAAAAGSLGIGRVGEQVRSALVDKGAAGQGLTAQTSAWGVVAVVGALLAAAAFGLAVRRAAGWPEMGSKYDAPAARPGASANEPDMWRALDHGQDPTS